MDNGLGPSEPSQDCLSFNHWVACVCIASQARTSLFSFLGAGFSPVLCSEPQRQSILLSLELEECGSVWLFPVCPYLRWQAFQDPGKTQGYRKAFFSTFHFIWTQESTIVQAKEVTWFANAPREKVDSVCIPFHFYHNSLPSAQFFDAFPKVLSVLSSVLSGFLWEGWFRYLVHLISSNGNLAFYLSLFSYVALVCFSWSF